MKILIIALLMTFSVLAVAKESRFNSITHDEAKNVVYALDFFYTECGFYPSRMDQLFKEADRAKCKLSSKKPFLKNDNKLKKLISLLKYEPLKEDKLGPQSFNLSFAVVSASR